jgi:hypothetical protein
VNSVSLLTPIVGRNPRATLVRIALTIGLAIVVFGWILVPLRLSGISMLPTYQDGTLNFVNRAAYWTREPKRGDVVAIRLAGPHAFYVKRIVGSASVGHPRVPAAPEDRPRRDDDDRSVERCGRVDHLQEQSQRVNAAHEVVIQQIIRAWPESSSGWPAADRASSDSPRCASGWRESSSDWQESASG